MSEDWGWYQWGYAISAFLMFWGCWIYCIVNYGFLLGVGLGWLPSIIAAAVVSIFWPAIVVGVAAIFLTWS